MRILLALLIAATLCRPGPVTAQELIADLSKHLISIESTFTGAELLLFGAVEGLQNKGEIDVAMVVRGPSVDVVLRRKARVGPIWVNYDAANISAVPGYYATVSTRPLDVIAHKEVLQRHSIGAANLNLDVTPPANGEIAPFRQALLRLRSNDNLYQNNSGGVRFLSDTLFRATVSMPANVPDGVFSASVYLFRDGNLIHAQTSPLYVSKAGFERFVYDLAHRQPLLYGILAVIIAIFAGWAASVAFRRN